MLDIICWTLFGLVGVGAIALTIASAAGAPAEELEHREDHPR